MEGALLPVGTVIAYAGPLGGAHDDATLPSARTLQLANAGWLPCDGRAVAVANYPNLFRAIGYCHGQGSGGAGWFRLPDYRGRFLRGVNAGARDDCQGSSQPRDPDAERRVAAATGGLSGARVGSVQCDALQWHGHNYAQAQASAGASSGTAATASATEVPTGDPLASSEHSSLSPNSAAETRPKNVYVHYLIRCRP